MHMYIYIYVYIYIYIYIYIDFLLRRLIIKCVCYFPEFVSFKTFRETSFERIWAKLYCFGSTFWHPFGEKLGPFWGVGSRPHFGPLLELLFWIFGAPGLPRRNPFWKPFRFMLPSRGALRLKIKDFGGVWLQSLFLKRFYSSKRTEFFSKWMPKCTPKAI